MKVRIGNLPADATEDDIRQLLDNSDDIENIDVVEEGDEDSPIAIVDLSTDGAAEGVIELLNGRKWKNTTLRADKLLY